MISPTIEYKYIALARLPRMLKCIRVNEFINILKRNSDVRIEIYRLLQLFLLSGLLSHVLGCWFGVVGKREHKRNERFDGQTLFTWAETRGYLVNTAGDFSKFTPWEL